MSTLIKNEVTQLDRLVVFGRNFFKHPKMLGSLIPSSRFLIRRLLNQVKWDDARVIVEYGPGVGVFTREILQRMRPDAVLVTLDTNREFCEFVEQSLNDPRLVVEHRSAAEIGAVLASRGIEQADYIISGIPFSTMPPEVRDAILVASRDILKPGGKFLVFQFSPSSLPFIRQVFPNLVRDFELLNVLPASLFFCTR
ncbi:MAG: rRNA adenine N-6-methyltransferase family protein [Herpetosiphon sp.]